MKSKLTHRFYKCLLIAFCCSWPIQPILANSDIAEALGDLTEDTEPVTAPQEVIHWKINGAKLDHNNNCVISLRLTADQKFSIYRKNLKFESPQGFLLSKTDYPTAKEILDPLSGEMTKVFSEGDFQLTFSDVQDITTFTLAITFLGCTEKICLFPYTQAFDIPITLNTSPPPSQEPTDTQSSKEDESYEKQLTGWISQASKHPPQTLWLLMLLIAFLGGLLTNLTPCVYPMIPITIRLLGKQTNKPFLSSSFYALGIVLSYSGLGLLAAWSGSMFGNFLGNIYVSTFFTLVMFALAFSMLGFFNLSFLQKLGQRLETHERGYFNCLIMGVGAGFIASPCTGPILASLLAYASTATPMKSFFILSIYSVGFALPYVFLGTLSAKISRIRLKPWVLEAVKVLFAGVIFALGFYYARLPLYEAYQQLTPHWGKISSIALGLAAIGFLFNYTVYKGQKLLMIGGALSLGLGIFSTAQSLLQPKNQTQLREILWHSSESTAFEQAQIKGGPVLIDMWAEWCEACKKMDRTTFSDPQFLDFVRSNNWTLLKIDLTQLNEKTQEIQESYGIQGLPTLVLFKQNPSLKKKLLVGFHNTQDLLEYLVKFQK